MADKWRKPGYPGNTRRGASTSVGPWSRFFMLRVVVWVVAILVVMVLSVFATAYLSSFDSVSEMISWYRSSFHF